MMMYDLAPCNIISIWRSEILYNSIKSSLINILVYGTYYVPTSNNKMFYQLSNHVQNSMHRKYVSSSA